MTAPCDWMRRMEDRHAIADAFQQAMDEFGIGEHLDGECPKGCDCTDFADAILLRVVQIAEEAKARKALDRLSLRIGATEERIRCILRDLTEDEGVLLLLHDGTPPPDAGWRDEDDCAAFVASTQQKVTEMWADLDGLYEQFEALLAAEAAAA